MYGSFPSLSDKGQELLLSFRPGTHPNKGESLWRHGINFKYKLLRMLDGFRNRAENEYLPLLCCLSLPLGRQSMWVEVFAEIKWFGEIFA